MPREYAIMPTSIPRSLFRWALRTALTGAVASVVSSMAVGLCSARETGRASAGVNAASQWIWGQGAKRHVRPSWRYTAVGYAVHHFSSMLWAGVYEYWCQHAPASSRAGEAGKAVAIAALAGTVDYSVTPRRFRPGFEEHLTLPSMAMIYVVFGAGLLLARTWQTPNPQSVPMRGHAKRAET
jgi:hypothetical protein